MTACSQRGSCIRGASRDTTAAGFARREREREENRGRERERELCPWAPSLCPPVVDSTAAPPRSGASGVSAEVRRTWSRGSLLVLRPSFLPPTTRTCFIFIFLLLFLTLPPQPPPPAPPLRILRGASLRAASGASASNGERTSTQPPPPVRLPPVRRGRRAYLRSD